MNKIFLIAVFLALATLNVEALKKSTLSNKVAVSEPAPKEDTSFLETDTSAFELKNFYEYYFYCQAYELYNNYALNSNSYCNTQKRGYWYGKKLNAFSIANFCRLIGTQQSSSYLSSYLCTYIQNTSNWFQNCAY